MMHTVYIIAWKDYKFLPEIFEVTARMEFDYTDEIEDAVYEKELNLKLDGYRILDTTSDFDEAWAAITQYA